MDASEVMVIFGLCLAVAFLVLLNGFFVAAEFALVKVRDTHFSRWRQRSSASMARHLLANLDAYLSACQLGITIASGWGMGPPDIRKLLEPVYDLKINGAVCWIMIMASHHFAWRRLWGHYHSAYCSR